MSHSGRLDRKNDTPLSRRYRGAAVIRAAADTIRQNASSMCQRDRRRPARDALRALALVEFLGGTTPASFWIVGLSGILRARADRFAHDRLEGIEG